MAGQIVSATVNVPLDNALRMAMSVKQASDRDTATWQRFGLVFGWSSWQLNLPYWGTTSTIETERLEEIE